MTVPSTSSKSLASELPNSIFVTQGRGKSKFVSIPKMNNFTLSRHLENFAILCSNQRYTYRVIQTIQMKLIFLCVWAELAVLGSAKTALKFKYEI